MPMKSVLLSMSVTNFSRSASARLRSVMSTPVGRQEQHPARFVLDGLDRDIDHPLAAVGDEVGHFSPKGLARGGLSRRRLDLLDQIRRRRPPRTFPERLPDDLLPRVAAAFPGQRFGSRIVPSTSMIPANSAPCSKNARNFAFAAAASASSWRSRCSACRWRVTSRTILDAPMTLPASSLMGEMVRDTRMRRPSDRTRSVSK